MVHQTEHTDADLVARCIEGDRDAWVLLLDRYGGLVMATARRHGADEHASADIYQTVFAILVRRLGTIRDHQSLAKWLITTTQRTARRNWSTRGSARLLDESHASEEVSPEATMEALERSRVVADAVDALGSPCRSLIRLLFLAQPTPDYASVARQLDMPIGSIGPTRARCLERLSRIITPKNIL